jgi:hypothetical protein
MYELSTFYSILLHVSCFTKEYTGGRSNLNENYFPLEHKSTYMNVLALTSYDMFKLATRTSQVPLHLNHQVQSTWQCKHYPAVLRSV